MISNAISNAGNPFTLATNVPVGSGKTAAGASNQTDPALPFLTADDIKLEERLFGKSDLAALEADTQSSQALKWVNQNRASGVIQGSLAPYVPGGGLTDADAAFFEKLTGTKSLSAALESSSDARGLIWQVSGSREVGTLTGDLTAGFLNNYLAVSTKEYADAKLANPASPHFVGLAAPDFVKKAIDLLESTNSSTINTVT